ncbi:hypothetical protein [Mesorhizobium sp. L103C131B0]|uniref:hypothetical protein n=1 Tax=Mesorhizobium sp. L103C131B0 TaxID=1287089 RepID=UPI0003D01204|nr:hypothetical protein [Mesorhizobium sp. L103C131B0]ESZ53665.1 hypothetical protein X729_30940 [Mesorhizobium sp. L103C131B0]
MEPIIAYNIMHSLELLINAVDVLRMKCVGVLLQNPEICWKHLEASTAVATVLMPTIGHERAALFAKEILASGKTIGEILTTSRSFPIELIAQVADPHLLTRPA